MQLNKGTFRAAAPFTISSTQLPYHWPSKDYRSPRIPVRFGDPYASYFSANMTWEVISRVFLHSWNGHGKLMVKKFGTVAFFEKEILFSQQSLNRMSWNFSWRNSLKNAVEWVHSHHWDSIRRRVMIFYYLRQKKRDPFYLEYLGF